MQPCVCREERVRHLTRRISSVICYDPFFFLQASSLFFFFFFYSADSFSHDWAPVSCYSLVATQSEVDTQTAHVIVQYWPCYCNCCLALLRREKHRTISWGVSLSHFFFRYTSSVEVKGMHALALLYSLFYLSAVMGLEQNIHNLGHCKHQRFHGQSCVVCRNKT